MSKRSFIGNYAIVTQGNESPDSYHLFSGLVALAGIVSGKVWMDMGTFCIRPNIYVILTGDPGVKKTTAMSIAKRLLRQLKTVPLSAECQTKESLTQDMATYTRVCAVSKYEVPNNFAPLDEEKSKFNYTPITIMVTEFSQFVGTSNAGHMLDFLTTIYDEEQYTASTKNKGKDTMPMPYVNFLACTVPDWITARMKDDVISGGFSRRALFIYEERTNKRIPIPKVTKEMQEAWEELLIQARNISNIKGACAFAPSAERFYCEWYEKLKPPTDPLLNSWYNSVHIQLLKLSILFAASEWESGQLIIEIRHMQMTLALLTDIEQNIPKVFKGVGRNELFSIGNQLLDMLAKEPSKKLPESFVKRQLFRNANPLELNNIISHLLSTNQIERIHTTDQRTQVRAIYLCLKDTNVKTTET